MAHQHVGVPEHPADTLILFDINGTLITRDARTDLPYAAAVNALFGVTYAMEGVDTSARSDKDVFMEVCGRQGHEFTPEKWETFLTLYTGELKRYAGTDVWRANADAVPFVRRLWNRRYALALISGELSVGAAYKLRKIGIWDCFLAGGFGEDGLRRFDIADRALEKVRETTGRSYETLYVIGDTVLDIETARHLGARSIAVTTGSHSREKLLAASPDHCVDRFAEAEPLFFR